MCTNKLGGLFGSFKGVNRGGYAHMEESLIFFVFVVVEHVGSNIFGFSCGLISKILV